MRTLAPNLFERRFQDFTEIGRARLPFLAPTWTDHNAHDPGITLMELLAWVAEAQLYSLSRLRRDERSSYAALLGLAPSGTRPARGLIWRNPLDPGSPAATFARSVVIPADATVGVLNTETPIFTVTHKLLWVPGRISKLESRLANGHTNDLSTVNERGGPAFQPFGESAGPRDMLAIKFACRDDKGLFGPRRQEAKGALWTVGVRAAAPLGGPASKAGEKAQSKRSKLSVTLVYNNRRIPVEIAHDSTDGLLSTGALLLNLDNVPDSPREFTMELRSSGGFARPPRWLRVEPNVIPIEQSRAIKPEPQEPNGMPGWNFDLDLAGLQFAPGEEPITLEVHDNTGLNTWQRRSQLSDCGPDDKVYELDLNRGRVTFGNGINGRIPAANSQVIVSYRVSDGNQGGIARNRMWKVAGFSGIFGVNPDPITGGAGSSGWIDQRREGRLRLRNDHGLISSRDLADAAKALPLLEVARAWTLPPSKNAPRTGVVTLVVMRSRSTPNESGPAPETRTWLEAIRRRLAARMPLGTQLAVVSPRYVEFTIQATLEATAGLDPAKVKQEVEKELHRRLALIGPVEGQIPRPPGVPVSRRDVAAWIRGTDGVGRVVNLRLIPTAGTVEDEIPVPPSGLPRWDSEHSDIEVERPAAGGTS